MTWLGKRAAAAFRSSSPVVGRLGQLIADGDGRYLTLNGLFAVVCRIVGTGLVTLSVLVMARLFGAADYGRLALFFTLGFAVVLVATVGLPLAACRLIPRYERLGQPGRQLGFVVASLVTATGLGGVLTVGLVSVLDLLGRHAVLAPFDWAAMILYVIGVAAIRVLSEVARAFGRPTVAALADTVMVRSVVLVGIAVVVLATGELVVGGALWLFAGAHHLAAAALLAVVGRRLSWRLPRQVDRRWLRAFRWRVRVWLSLGASLMVTPLFYFVLFETDMIVLGLFRPPAEIGLYNVARRLAEFMQFASHAIVPILLPQIAHAYARREYRRIQRVADLANGLAVAPAMILLVLLALLGPWVLGWFGPGFAAAYPVMMLLCLARLIDILFGTATEVLAMSGQQRTVSRIGLRFGIVNIAANLALVPPFGATGAAIATGVTLIGWKTAIYLACSRSVPVETCLPLRLWRARPANVRERRG